ncbi:MAG TPA: sugar phosphate isomerase/epimerase family protein [Opitutaceae bacterium]
MAGSKQATQDTAGTRGVACPAIRIGNQTAYSAGSILEPFEFALAHRFQAFEFFPDRGHFGLGGWAEHELDDASRRWIRNTAAENDVELTVHAALTFNPLRNPHDARLSSTIEFARDIGATLVNLHLEMEQGAEPFVQALRPALTMTAETNLKLAIENTVLTGPRDFNAVFAVLRQHHDIPSAHAGMCLDLGHANLYGEMKNDFMAYLDALSPDVPITHLHLHENFGDRDSHLPLFTGPSRGHPERLVALLDRLARRSFKGCAILEQWPHPPSLLVDARDRLCELIERRG